MMVAIRIVVTVVMIMYDIIVDLNVILVTVAGKVFGFSVQLNAVKQLYFVINQV